VGISGPTLGGLGAQHHHGMNEPMPETQTLLALLAGGPYGVADKAGSINRSLVMRTCREDGVLLRAAKPITMLDAAWRSTFERTPKTSLSPPLAGPNVTNVWGTFSQVGGLRWSYVLGIGLQEPFLLRVADLATTGELIAAEYWHGLLRGQFTLLSGKRSAALAACPNPPKQLRYMGSSYMTFSPVLSNGWCLLGEPEKIVTVSARRLAAVTVSGASLALRVRAAAGETFKLHLLPPVAVESLRRAATADTAALPAVQVECKAADGSASDQDEDVIMEVRCDGEACTCS